MVWAKGFVEKPHPTGVYLLVLLAGGILGSCRGASSEDPQQTEGRYIYRAEDSRTVVVFVHGVLGNSTETWTNDTTQAYWPELLAKGPGDRTNASTDGLSTYVFQYKSPLFRFSRTVQEEAHIMEQVLHADGIFEYERIAFVAHSMGGLVVREFLLDFPQHTPKIRFALFLATPTEGSEIAKVASWISTNPQFRYMKRFDVETRLGANLLSWSAAQFEFSSYCLYETEKIAGELVVPIESATRACNNYKPAPDENHITIAKPASFEAFQHGYLLRALSDSGVVYNTNIRDGDTIERVVPEFAKTTFRAPREYGVEYFKCSQDLLQARLIPGPLRGRSVEDLIRQLPNRTIERRTERMEARRNDSRFSYEVTCESG